MTPRVVISLSIEVTEAPDYIFKGPCRVACLLTANSVPDLPDTNQSQQN